MKPFLPTAALLFTLVPAAAGAQGTSQFSAGIDVGAAGTWGDESSLGKGLLAGARVGFDLTDRTALEAAVTRIAHQRTFWYSHARVDGRSIVAGVAFRHDVTRGRTRPFVLAGLGMHDNARTWTDPEGQRSFSGRSLVRHVGGGVAFRRGRWEHGPEARLYAVDVGEDGGPKIIMAAAYRVGARF